MSRPSLLLRLGLLKWKFECIFVLPISLWSWYCASNSICKIRYFWLLLLKWHKSWSIRFFALERLIMSFWLFFFNICDDYFIHLLHFSIVWIALILFVKSILGTHSSIESFIITEPVGLCKCTKVRWSPSSHYLLWKPLHRLFSSLSAKVQSGCELFKIYFPQVFTLGFCEYDVDIDYCTIFIYYFTVSCNFRESFTINFASSTRKFVKNFFEVFCWCWWNNFSFSWPLSPFFFRWSSTLEIDWQLSSPLTWVAWVPTPTSIRWSACISGSSSWDVLLYWSCGVWSCRLYSFWASIEGNLCVSRFKHIQISYCRIDSFNLLIIL